MAVRVVTSDGQEITFESADSWSAGASGILSVDTETEVSGMFHANVWAYALLVSETTTK